MLPRLPVLAAIAAAVALPAVAQTAPPAPTAAPMKTVGQPQEGKPVPSLIVLNARGATLQGKTLTLSGVSPTSIVFADRPVRAAGHAATSHILEEWSVGSDSFGKDPPNATVSVLGRDGGAVKDAVVVLKSPKMQGDALSFDVDVLEGDLAGADGPASVFIDIIGMPFTPLSFAGVARRSAYRAAWYGHPYPYAYPPPYAYHPYYPPYPPYPPPYPPPYYRPY